MGLLAMFGLLEKTHLVTLIRTSTMHSISKLIFLRRNRHPADRAPVFVGAVAHALDAPLHHVVRRRPQVVRPADFLHALNEPLGRVEIVVQLVGPVVVGEDVVVVVPPLAQREKRHELVVGRPISSANKIRNSSCCFKCERDRKITCRMVCGPGCGRSCSRRKLRSKCTCI
jgi:hypothetical protein